MNTPSVHIGKVESLIVWIRRELRVRDHLALFSALRDARKIIPLYIMDEGFHASPPAKKKVLLDGLTDLRSSLRNLGGDLIIRSGDPAAVLHHALRETGASGIYLTTEYVPDIRLRDRKIRSSVESAGKVWKQFQDQVLLEGEEILPSGRSNPYTVFTPFQRAWKMYEPTITPSLPRFRKIETPRLSPGEIPDIRKIAPGAETGAFPSGGESAARRALKSFLNRSLPEYHQVRDFPAHDGTSRLSHHLATGSVSIRTVYHAVRKHASSLRGLQQPGPGKFLDELLWREFYYQILAGFPHVANGAFKNQYDRLSWSSNRRHFDAWCAGMTGYPVIDAAMRQLAREGWMHNRARMIVASFLTKDLHVDWRKGEAFFMQHLADGDLALNNGGWQWCAGTGTDAQPWFRIFNPVTQSKKFDLHGEYIKKYLPELRRVPHEFIHEPRFMPPTVQKLSGCRIGRDYPAPIVDHERERRVALEMYRGIQSRNT